MHALLTLLKFQILKFKDSTNSLLTGNTETFNTLLYLFNRKLQGYVRFQVLTAASMMFRAVFWVVLPRQSFYPPVQPRRQL
jgi:hypothetical protein